jgi:hypothetical protein
MNKGILSIHKWSLEHPLINYLIIAIPIMLFTVMQIAPRQLGLVNDDGVLYWFPSIIFWLSVLVSVLYPFIIVRGDKINTIRDKKGSLVLQKVIESLNSVCNKKTNRFIDYINMRPKKDISNPFLDITQPALQIELLIEELNTCLAYVFNMNKSDIGISIMYKFQSDRKWDWLSHVNLKSGFNIEQLTSNNKSSAKQIIDGKTSYIFCRDKLKAESDGKYIKGKADRDESNFGSIVCRNISVESDRNNYLQCVLSISTYGKYICEAEEELQIKNVLDYLLIPFDARFKLELSLYYIKIYTDNNTLRNA